MVAMVWIQLFLFIGVLFTLTPLLGRYIAQIFTGKRTAMSFLRGLEGLCYRAGGVDFKEEMSWLQYGKALLLFNLVGFSALLLLLRLQYYLPLNPQHFPAVPWLLAFNITCSFVTNTNWQSYAGESTLSYFSQMTGLAVQNFFSAATGMAALLVLIRGLTRKTNNTVGNFWVDLVRTIIYILLPLCILLALVLVGEGVIQSFSAYKEVVTMENGKQTIPLGPVASQVAIKQLGTNGGGFFNANSAHPFENPTGFSNFLETLSILLIPAAMIYAYGMMIRSKKHAWLLFGLMFAFWAFGLVVSLYSEHLHNPVLNTFPVFEGKETRFGTVNSLLWAVTTTDTSNGSVNAMISSFSPLAGGIALFNIMLGELIFGGVGVGLCSLIMFVLLTVFLSGLMVGRTPEYLGKKVEKHEIKWVIMAVLMPGALILIGTGASIEWPGALTSLGNAGPHGLTELLYAFTSAAGNNGSAFAGINANTDYYNLTLGLTMLLARVSILLPSLAIGGLLAQKKFALPSIGTFSTNTGLFAILLASVILIVGALTFFPALSLGPLIEHYLMLSNRSF